jgi:hypothetical protein
MGAAEELTLLWQMVLSGRATWQMANTSSAIRHLPDGQQG